MIKNLTYQASSVMSRGYGAAISFLVNALLTRNLDQNISGIIFYCLATSAFLSIISRWGIDIACLRNLSSAEAEDKRPIFQEALIAASISLCGALLIGHVILLLVPTTNTHPLETAILLTSALVSLTLTNISCETIKSQGKNSEGLFLQTALQPTIAALFIFITDKDLLSIILAISASYLICSVAAIIRATSVLPKSPKNINYKIYTTLKQCTPLMLIGAINSLMETSDSLILGIFRNPEEVSIYYICAKLASLSTMVLFVINGAIAPKISQNWKTNKPLVFDLIKTSTKKMLALACLILLIAAVLHPVILNIFGEAHKIHGTFPFITLSIGYFFVLAAGPLGVFMTMTGHHRRYLSGNLIVCVMNISLNLLLIPTYGIKGACIATAASLAAKNIILLLQYRSIRVKFP
ncbi:Polysaccharide biosynthesis protein [compost metagenome]